MKSIRIGAVNWDASLTADTYFGFYQTNSLSRKKYITWTPFYAETFPDGRVVYHERTPEEYEQEMQYAIDAGVDYFAYVWYPEEGSRAHVQDGLRDCSHKVYELNYARRLYERSSLKSKLSMCAILAAHPFTDRDLEDLVDAFTTDYYEKIDGRPLLYVYLGYREEIIDKIHAICKKRGLPVPYTVPMVSDAMGAENFALADALSAYAICAEGVTSHDALISYAIEKNEGRICKNLALIPTFTVGWNPSPRIERPTPWTSKCEGVSNYPDVSYAPRATCEELYLGAERFADFINERAKDSFIGHILTFSWNEFEEGGYFCPTLTENGKIDTARVEAFSKISELFKKKLS